MIHHVNATLLLYISTLFIPFLTSSLWGIPPFQTVSKKIQILMSWLLILYCLKPNFDSKAWIAFFLPAGLKVLGCKNKNKKVLKMNRHSTWPAFFPSLSLSFHQKSEIWRKTHDRLIGQIQSQWSGQSDGYDYSEILLYVLT